MKIGDLVAVYDPNWNSNWSNEIGIIIETKPWHEEGHRVCVMLKGDQKHWFYHDQLKIVNSS